MPGLDLPLLAEAARLAGEITLRFWRASPQVWDKGGDHGPVTEADLAVNDALKTMLLAARPDYGWLSEETPDSPERLSAKRVFVLDPIDGTRAFVAGEDNFAVSLAVVEAGRVLAGAVMLPAKNRLYTGEIGGPALCNGVAIKVSARQDLGGSSLLATKANMEPAHWPGGVPDLRRSFRTSLAYRLCLAAEGRYDGMITFRDTWEWDIAAGSLICECAGARVTDRTGAALRFNAPKAMTAGVIATNPALHQAIMARL
ncbi:3'(2'),5'-bisphosphate nucleotidase CysQ [Pseudorhodobacter sp. MZDSW-24AT]|uniref:3'(2'),5'-bisphosphate nucleotidase CysQ n=1 Tax=Pseudorhodobacter sp. MZDSW-24AT TaxID=2052957 RepID=UPI000C1DFC2D|nr:3'(2'),5'-bisphosphate nucleotidase CysQ [Pseudorhodobacter sp. MZDSW-24AT]PJF09922.1 3'(2'),5'-bisphosphate nucleotidase CysQ [Pseudorhodobacter sp. MZDSW-24AT]